MKLKFENGNDPKTGRTFVVTYSRSGSAEIQSGVGIYYGEGDWAVYGSRGLLAHSVTYEKGMKRIRAPKVHQYAKVA